jgi:paraquat-inducible protein B
MSEENRELKHAESAPVAQVQTRHSFSIIWVVPIIALLIGGGLIFKAQSTKGPTITITFKNADGLVAGKTKIKYKDVVVGEVTGVDLSDDFSKVVVTAELTRDAGSFLTEKTRFWVVRARIGAGEVSGLGTLFSGAYIGIDPSTEGREQDAFTGLETPPILTKGLPGGNFILKADQLDSLDLGSPIYYRGIKVGQVVAYHFDKDAEAILLNVFIKAPYHEKVLQNSRFWSVSGFDFTMDANGITVDTQSLVSIMSGGVAFGLPVGNLPGEAAKDGTVFSLYPNRESSTEEVYTIKRYYLMYFDQSIRGLSPGAPVEIMGVKIGEVLSTKLVFNEKVQKFLIPVLVSIEPERLAGMISADGEVLESESLERKLQNGVKRGEIALLFQTEKLVESGFRAQLKTGNLLTGKLYIDLDYYPDAPPAKIITEGAYPVFPTVAAPLERISQRVDNILKKIEALPLNEMGQNINDILQKVDDIPITEMGNNLNVAIESLTQTLNELKALSNNINEETMPKVNDALSGLETTINGINTAYGPDSTFNHNAKAVTDELSLTLRSLRSLLEYLEKDPDALIFGKRGGKK